MRIQCPKVEVKKGVKMNTQERHFTARYRCDLFLLFLIRKKKRKKAESRNQI